MFNRISQLALKVLEPIIASAVIATQAIFFFFVPTDFNGDPNDYVSSAKTFFQGSGISTIRFAGYPFFLKLFSGDLSNFNFVFFVQSALFILSLFLFARTITGTSWVRALIYTPALIPAVAYSQKLLFPDGLLLSLILFWISFLISKKLKLALLTLVLLVLIKLVFIGFGLIYLIYVLKLKRPELVKYHKVIFGTGFVLLIPAMYILYPFFLYLPVVQQAQFQDVSHNSVQKLREFDFICNNVSINVKNPAVLDIFYEPSVDVYNSPLSPTFVREKNCSAGDLDNLRRELVLNAIFLEPQLQIHKFSDKFIGALLLRPQMSHLDYMLQQKALLRSEENRAGFSYFESELNSFDAQGISPFEQPGDILVKTIPDFIPSSNILKLLILGSFGILLIAVFVTRTKISDGGVTLAAIWIYIPFATSAFAWPVDRYLICLPFVLVAFSVLVVRDLKRSYLVALKK